MLVHRMFRTSLPSGDTLDDFDERLDRLPRGFSRTLQPSRKYLAGLLGLSTADPSTLFDDKRFTTGIRETMAKAELIATDTHLFIVRVGRLSRRIRTGGDSADNPPRLTMEHIHHLYLHSLGPCLNSAELKKIVGFVNKQFSVTLKGYTHNAEQLDGLKEEGRISPEVPSDKDLTAAQILSDRPTRILAVAIKQSSGLLVDDLQKQLPPADRSRIEDIRNDLYSANLIVTETVVICKKTGSQVAKVADPASLQSFANSGLKCACGTPMNNEQINAAVSISDLGRRLLDGSYWLTLLLVHHLIDLGVPIERLLVEQVTGGDEIDCIADIDGKIILFELKDKEFNLGSAYSFGAKIGLMDPEYSVIVTTAHVGADARDHFTRSRRIGRRDRYSNIDDEGQAVVYIEGVASLRAGLMELISRISITQVDNFLTEALSMSSVPTSSLLTALDEKFAKIDPLSGTPLDLSEGSVEKDSEGDASDEEA